MQTRQQLLIWHTVEWRQWLVAALVVLGTSSWAQTTPDEGAGEEAHRLAPGIWLKSVVFDLGGYKLPPSPIGRDRDDSALWLFAGGGAAAVTWQLPGRRMLTSVDYSLGYAATQRFGTLNGFDQTLSINVRTTAARRLRFALTASGQSLRMYSSLFDVGHSLTVEQQPFSPARNPEILIDNTAVLSASPAELAFSGARRTLAGVHAGSSYYHSRRLISHIDIGARHRRFSPVFSEVGVRLFPAVTMGTANGGLTYSLKPRTRITLTGGYGRSYTRLGGFHWGSVEFGLQRDLGRRSFVYGRGGYGRTARLGPRDEKNTYVAAAGLGTVKRHHTVTATFSRGIGDSYGLHTDTSIAFEGAWSWRCPASSWTARSSFEYLRNGGRSLDLRGWVHHTNIARRVTANFSLSFDITQMRTRGIGFGVFSGAGVAISCIWSPRSGALLLH